MGDYLIGPTVWLASGTQEIYADQETIGKISAAGQCKFVFIERVLYLLNSMSMPWKGLCGVGRLPTSSVKDAGELVCFCKQGWHKGKSLKVG